MASLYSMSNGFNKKFLEEHMARFCLYREDRGKYKNTSV